MFRVLSLGCYIDQVKAEVDEYMDVRGGGAAAEHFLKPES